MAGPRRWAALAVLLAVACGDVSEPPREVTLGDFVAPRPGDFGYNPYLGIETSRRHLYVVLEDGADERAPELLALAISAEGVGGLPDSGVLQLVLPEATDFEGLEEAFRTLESQPSVEAVAFDVRMHGDSLPKPIAWTEWSWDERPSSANWGLKSIRAPLAWNLNERIEESGAAPTSVGIIDQHFAEHPDLAGRLLAADLPVGPHGMRVAGIIGAIFNNGAYVDGINPSVVMNAYGFRQAAGTPEDVSVSYGETLANIVAAAGAHDRIVNVSLGYNWSRYCFADGTGGLHRCDPREGDRVADSGCDSDRVRASIDAAGKVFARAIETLNRRAPVLVVVSAGNDAGSGVADYCSQRSSLFGMGEFPARLSSPMTASRSEHVIVVGSLTASGEEATTSNRGADVLAPGEEVGVLGFAEGTPLADLQSGTSLAAPFVAGAAAFVVRADRALALDNGSAGELGNPELRRLLIQEPYTRVSGVERSLDLYGAVTGLDVIRAGSLASIRRWLADIDDGSNDGFQRVIYGDDGSALEDVLTDRRGGDGIVDFRDFRRLRDTYWMSTTAGWLDARVVDGNPKLDLNLDGEQHNNAPELYPRAALDFDGRVSTEESYYLDETSTHDLDVMAEVYQPGPVQRWPASSLPKLLGTADVHVRAAEAIAALGADGVVVELDGLPGALGAPDDLSPLGELTVGPDEVILSTPLTTNAVLRWRPICDGAPSAEAVEQPLGTLGGAADVIARLDPEAHPGCDEAIMPNFPPDFPAGWPASWTETYDYQTRSSNPEGTLSMSHSQHTEDSIAYDPNGWTRTFSVRIVDESSSVEETISNGTMRFDRASGVQTTMNISTTTQTLPDGTVHTQTSTIANELVCGNPCAYIFAPPGFGLGPACRRYAEIGGTGYRHIYYDGSVNTFTTSATNPSGSTYTTEDTYSCAGCGGGSMACTCEDLFWPPGTSQDVFCPLMP